ncbi:hypothetical protein [Streptomyces sp. NPDC020983]|uniref:hypothetical protein n=1 Tax=Streptomyces sp. NPDC020983 TaxID=3365106 RepID=UPI00379CB2A4
MARHTCTSDPRTVASYPAGDPRATIHAERDASDQRASGHPEAHTHYNTTHDTFTVIVSGGGAQ